MSAGAVSLKKSSDTVTSFSLDDLGYSVLPAHTYAVRIDPSLETLDGQKLGYTWMAVIQFWHKSAFTSFGDGHGVWESSGGPLLPFPAPDLLPLPHVLSPLPAVQAHPAPLPFPE